MTSGRINDAIDSLMEWLLKAEDYLEQDKAILGDLDTVSILIEKHKLFHQEVNSRRNLVVSLTSSPDLQNTKERTIILQKLWEKVKELTDQREFNLKESLKLAETFNDSIQVVRDWLPDAEAELKFHAIPDDEDSIMQLIENHEKFQDELQSQQDNIDKIKELAEEILSNCHSNAVRFVKYYLTITQTRWEQAISRSNQRSLKLHEALKTTRENASTLNQLMGWLNDECILLQTKEKDQFPQDLALLEALNKEHLDFHEDLMSKSKDIDRIVKSFTIGGSNSQSPSSTLLNKRNLSGKKGHMNKSQNSDGDSMSLKASALLNKWKLVMKMSCDRKKILQEALSKNLELENCRNFEFDQWRQRYISWNRSNKLKFMDFFRRQDRHGTGLLTRKEFIDGVMASKFPTNETELIMVFNVFDVKRLGRIQYKTFLDAIMKPEKSVTQKKNILSNSELKKVEIEIENQLSKCQCQMPFKIIKVTGEKFKFGEKEKLCNVRLINGGVYVRFGSSWLPLLDFMNSQDPCRVKPRSFKTVFKSMNKSLSDLSGNKSFVFEDKNNNKSVSYFNDSPVNSSHLKFNSLPKPSLKKKKTYSSVQSYSSSPKIINNSNFNYIKVKQLKSCNFNIKKNKDLVQNNFILNSKNDSYKQKNLSKNLSINTNSTSQTREPSNFLMGESEEGDDERPDFTEEDNDDSPIVRLNNRLRGLGLNVNSGKGNSRHKRNPTAGGVSFGRKSTSSSSSSTSTWPRRENQNNKSSLTSSVDSTSTEKPSKLNQQSPGKLIIPSPLTSTHSSLSTLRNSRKSSGFNSTPNSTANSPSSRHSLKTFTSSRSPQRISKTKTSPSDFTKASQSKRHQTKISQTTDPSLFFTSNTLNI